MIHTPSNASTTIISIGAMGRNERVSNTTIPVSSETLELVRAQKRGGITYDELLREMAEQYSPENGESGSYNV